MNCSAGLEKKHFIVVIGAGYVGLTTAVCMADLGHSVVCVDIDEDKVRRLNRGSAPIYETDFSEMLSRNLNRAALRFHTDVELACQQADFVFLCLPTPTLRDGTVETLPIEILCKRIRSSIGPNTVVINKSTVPPGTARRLSLKLKNCLPVVSNPEFLREGSAIHDFMYPDRIVIGADDEEVAQSVENLYRPFSAPTVLTDTVSAECIKYMANSYLATKVSFVNEAARYCEAVGARVVDVLDGLSFDPRIGASHLFPGPGWGGSCFPKDTEALVAAARSVGSPMTLVEQAIESNRKHMTLIVELIEDRMKKIDSETKKIAMLGLSFKANTDDTRESPAISIVQRLSNKFMIAAYDPVALKPQGLDVLQVSSIEAALEGAHLVLLLTEWEEFSDIDPRKAIELMAGNEFLDLRYILDREKFAEAGLSVSFIGQ
jgi:UDPglucose 6-dehydrogenase